VTYGGARGKAAHAVTSMAAAGTRVTDGSQTAVPGFTAEQVQCIISLIDTTKDGYEKLSGKGELLFDSGASCHMIENYGYLGNVRNTEPIMVGLLDGRQAITSKIRTITLGSNLKLKACLLLN